MARPGCSATIAGASLACLLVGVAGPAPGAVSGQPPFGEATATFTEGDSPSWIALDVHRDRYLYVRGRLNGRETDVVVDSGAGATVIDAGLAKSLGMALEGGVRARGVGGTVPAKMTRNVTLQLGSVRLSLAAAVIIDLHGVTEQIDREMPVIVGHELFRNAVVEVDWPGRRLALHRPSTFQSDPAAVMVPLRYEGRRLQLDGRVEGLGSARFEIDTGSADTLVLFQAYTRTHQLLKGRTPMSTRRLGGVGGSTVESIGTLRRFTVGTVTMSEVPTVFHDSGTGAFAASPAAGLVGSGLLGRLHVAFDVPAGRLVIVSAPASDSPFPRDRLGLQVVRRGSALQVVHVAAGSPAERAGWRTGDRVVALNGEAIPANYWALWTGAVSGASGTIVTLRDGRGADRRLALADYY